METHPVDIWTIELDRPRAPLLSAEETARAARFRFEADRLHWTNARTALRIILAAYLQVSPGTIAFTFGPDGKPIVEGVEFNLSHARNRAMIAVSQDIPVGVDIEIVRENVEMAKLLERIGERVEGGGRERLFQQWVRREARTKATGGPLMRIPPPDVVAIDLIAPPGFAAAVALRGRIPLSRYCGEGEV